MRRKVRIMLCFFASLIMIFTNVAWASSQEAFIGVISGENTGIQTISKLTIVSDGGKGLCLYAEGTTVKTDTVVHMVLVGPQGEETTCTVPTEGNKTTSELLCYPGIGFEFADGYYEAAFIDAYGSVKVSETTEKGYRIFFEIKDNTVQPGWESKREESGHVEQSTEQTTSSGGIVSGEDVTAQPRDISGHWAEKEIRALLERGVVSGYHDGTFRPNDKVTRAEFSQIVKQAFTISDAKEKSKFVDVKRGDWHYSAITALYETKIVSGTDFEHFSPDESITREQMAVILKRTADAIHLDLATKRDYIPFADDTEISGYAKEAVKVMYQAGIVSGVKAGQTSSFRYLPGEGATRAEVATIVNQLLSQTE